MTTIPDLSSFSSEEFDRGRPLVVEWLWRAVSAVVFQSPCVPFYGVKRALLRLFGASVGRGVVIKPRVTVTFPWKLSIGDHAWIGEGVWLDSLDRIALGDHVCISQNAYLCTGNHDYRSATFDLRCAPIRIERGAWIAAAAVVGPGVAVGEGAVLTLGSVATGALEAGGIYRGNPASRVGARRTQ